MSRVPFPVGIPEVDTHILLRLSDDELFSACMVDTYTKKVCDDDDFWKDKVEHDYGGDTVNTTPENVQYRIQSYLLSTPINIRDGDITIVINAIMFGNESLLVEKIKELKYQIEILESLDEDVGSYMDNIVDELLYALLRSRKSDRILDIVLDTGYYDPDYGYNTKILAQVAAKYKSRRAINLLHQSDSLNTLNTRNRYNIIKTFMDVASFDPNIISYIFSLGYTFDQLDPGIFTPQLNILGYITTNNQYSDISVYKYFLHWGWNPNISIMELAITRNLPKEILVLLHTNISPNHEKSINIKALIFHHYLSDTSIEFLKEYGYVE